MGKGPYSSLSEALDSQDIEQQEQFSDLAGRYNRLFSAGIGLDVLTDILVIKLGLFNTLKDEHDLARHNAAVEILVMTGVLRANPRKIIEAMMNLTKEMQDA